ncbi:MAG: lipoate--protein ligase family protein, partial [Gemmatimonadota bacterium]
MSRAWNVGVKGSADQPWRLVRGTGLPVQDAPRRAAVDLEGSDSITPADGATNMAVDAALLESVQAGAPPVLRLYRWSPACLSFGRNQPARGRYDRDLAEDRGIDFVRRPTGGQAVLHDDELTYAVIAPVAVIGKPRTAYAAINRALVAALRELGV